MCSSQNSRPHFRQLTLPLSGPSLLSHNGSVHTSCPVGRSQCFLETSSSGSITVSMARPGAIPTDTGCVSFDSNTSRPRSFWLMRDSGWNRFALRTCLSNHDLTSSCSASGSSWWISSRCRLSCSSVTYSASQLNKTPGPVLLFLDEPSALRILGMLACWRARSHWTALQR